MTLIKGHSKTTRKVSHTKQVEAFLERLKESHVTIGVHDDAGQYPGPNAPSVAQVALWNEFGTVNMPERSFLRSTVKNNQKFIQTLCQGQVKKCLHGATTPDKALSVVGFNVQAMVQKTIQSNVPPELSPDYAASKRRKHQPDRTLIATRLLLRSVTYRVQMNGSVTAGDTSGSESSGDA